MSKDAYSPRVISDEEMEAMAREQALERVYPEELLLGGGALKGAKAAKQGVVKAVDHLGRPRVVNKVVTPKAGGAKAGPGVSLGGRLPAKPEDVTHAYRNVSQRELDDILASKFARRDPTPGAAKRTWSDEGKWWSGGDETGTFGRKWNKGDATLRTAADKVPKKRAVRAEELEVYDAAAKRFVPLSKEAKPARFSEGGEVAPRGVGLAKRGWGKAGKK
jgi:hypothetical protein